VEKGLEMCLPALDVLDSLCEVSNCIIEIHKPGVDKASIEVIYSVVWFEGNCFLELGQSIIDLV
jgi:hypothetical protein